MTIASVVILAKKYVDSVIVVDDGSSDLTSEVARSVGAQVYTLPHNLGKAGAMKHGFTEAISRNPDAIVMLDGDGQHNPAEIPMLLGPILRDEADFVIGSRFLNNAGQKVPHHRRIGQIVLDKVVSQDEVELTDTQSGYRAFGPVTYQHLLTITSHGYNIEIDLINTLCNLRLRVIEVPILVKYCGLPNIHKKNPILHGIDVIIHIFGLIGYQRPLLCFGIPGTVSLCIGIILGLLGFDIYDTTKLFPISYALMSVLLIISGLLLGMTAILLNAIDVILKREFNTIK